MNVFRQSPGWLTIPVVVFLITRLLVVGALYLPRSGGIILFESPDFNHIPMEDVPPALQPWARWDGAWYVLIAESGYAFVPDSTVQQENTVAFFPLYPLLIRAGMLLINNGLLVGIILSNTCFLLALMVLHRLAEAYFDPSVASRSVLYIAIFPTALFFSAIYTESLFLLLSLLAAWYSLQKRWALAALSGAVASATRAQGVFLIFLIGFEWAKSNRWLITTASKSTLKHNFINSLRSNLGGLVCLALIPTGLLLYMLYLHLTFGNALAFNDAQRAWDRQTVGPLNAILSVLATTFSNKPNLAILPYYHILEIAGFFVGLALSIWVYRRMGLGYGMYCFISLWVAASGRIQGQLRFSVVLFPLFMILAVYSGARLNKFYCLLCFILLPLFTFFFTNWIAVG